MFRNTLLSFFVLFSGIGQANWYAGPKIGVSEASFHYEESLAFSPAFQSFVDRLKHDVRQYGGSFGGVAGYQCPLGRCNTLGFEVAGAYTNGSANFAWADALDLGDQLTRSSLEGTVEVCCVPGHRITRCVLGYLRGGYAAGFVKHRFTSRQLVSQMLDPVAAQVEKHKTLNGFVFGAGLRASVNQCLSVQAEFNQYGFPQTTTIANVFDPIDLSTHTWEISRTRARTFTLATNYQF